MRFFQQKPKKKCLRLLLLGLFLCVPLLKLPPLAKAIELADILKETNSPVTTRTPWQEPNTATSTQPTLPTTDFKSTPFATKLSKPEDLVINPNALVLDFKEALNLGIHNNLVLAIMEHNTQRSQAAKLESISNLLPDIQLYYRQSRFVGGIQVFNGNPNKAYITTILPEFRAKLPLNLGGAEIFDILAKADQVKLNKAAQHLVSQDQLLFLSEDFLTLISLHLEVQALHQAKAETEGQLRLAKARYGEGVGVLLEVLEAQNLLDAQSQKILATTEQLKATNYRLNVHFGFQSDTEVVPKLSSVTQLKFFNDELSIEQCQSLALTESPTLKQAFSDMKAKQNDFRKSVAAFMPNINLNGYLNHIGPNRNNLLESKYAGFEIQWDALEGLGLTKSAKSKQAHEDFKVATLAYQLKKREVEKEVATQFNAMQTQKALIPLAKNRLLTSEQAKEQAFGRYQNGLGNYLEVLTASSNLIQARSAYVQQQLNFKRSQLKLANNLGTLKAQLVALASEASPLLAENKTVPTRMGNNPIPLPPSSLRATVPKNFNRPATLEAPDSDAENPTPTTDASEDRD
jgi:outer membrane protein TolC